MHGRSFVALVLLAVAFGVVEAAIVGELRWLLDPRGTLFPAVVLPPELLRVEQAREMATILVLAAAAWLASSGATARLAAFLVAFGVWDLAYYAALRVWLGWPRDAREWDVLFLVPVPWFGPVWAPLVVASTMVGCGGIVLVRSMRGRPFGVRPLHAAAAVAGGALVTASFLGTAPEPPARYPWELLLLGEAVGIAAFLDAWRRASRS